MAVFAYRAFEATGKRITGTLSADSAPDARQQLRERGLRIERFAPTRSRSTHRRGLRFSSARREESVAEFARLSALLLRSGVTLAEALEVLIEQARGRWQVVLRDVGESLTAGSSLADAIERHRDRFDEVFVQAVRVGERAGTLEASLTSLAEYLKDRRALAGKVTSALVYPVILSVVAVGVVLFLMSYVVPQLLTVLQASGQDLPRSTVVLKAASDLLLRWWPVLLIGSAAGCALFTAAIGTRRGRMLWHRTLLRLPLLGVLMRKTLVSRFAQQLSIMLSTGIPFTEAVGIVRKTSSNAVLAEELGRMEEAVTAGGDIAAALAGSRIFPPLVARVVAVGQNTGELTDVLNELRAGYEAEVRIAVTRFTAALEPLLVMVMASVVGLIVFATLMPILQATKGIS